MVDKCTVFGEAKAQATMVCDNIVNALTFLQDNAQHRPRLQSLLYRQSGGCRPLFTRCFPADSKSSCVCRVQNCTVFFSSCCSTWSTGYGFSTAEAALRKRSSTVPSMRLSSAELHTLSPTQEMSLYFIERHAKAKYEITQKYSFSNAKTHVMRIEALTARCPNSPHNSL